MKKIYKGNCYELNCVLPIFISLSLYAYYLKMGPCLEIESLQIELDKDEFALEQRRKWQPTPVFLPGESQGRGSLVGSRLWGRTGSDTTEATQQQQQQSGLLIHYDQCPYKKRNIWTQTHIQETHHVEMKIPTREMFLQAKECQRLQYVARSWERDKEQIFFLTALKRNEPC